MRGDFLKGFFKSHASREFIAEFLSTMVLVTFGDGVVAQVRVPSLIERLNILM